MVVPDMEIIVELFTHFPHPNEDKFNSSDGGPSLYKNMLRVDAQRFLDKIRPILKDKVLWNLTADSIVSCYLHTICNS